MDIADLHHNAFSTGGFGGCFGGYSDIVIVGTGERGHVGYHQIIGNGLDGDRAGGGLDICQGHNQRPYRHQAFAKIDQVKTDSVDGDGAAGCCGYAFGVYVLKSDIKERVDHDRGLTHQQAAGRRRGLIIHRNIAAGLDD